MYERRVDTLLGELRLIADPQALRAICFSGQAWEYPGATQLCHTALLDDTAEWVAQFCAAVPADSSPVRATVGTDFQRAVWAALRDLPSGSTCSYSTLATVIGKPAAVRAVGAAVGRNPWSLLVPCHRVVGAGGALTGYAGGLGRKRALLALEQGSPLPWRAVVSAYQTQYHQPLDLRPGDAVHWQVRPDDGEFPGWAFALDAQGIGGWAPRAWFTDDAEHARAKRSYTSRELDVQPGDQVLELSAFGGWIYARHRDGRCGWLPQVVLGPEA